MEQTVDGSILSTIEAQKSAFDNKDFELARMLAASVFERVKRSAVVTGRLDRECDASVIIVSYRCNDRTLELLKAANSWSLPFRHEIIVVINDDSSLRLVVGNVCPNAVVIDSPINLGASGGRNLGAHHASGKYLIYLDDDGWTDEKSLTALFETCRKYNATGVRGRVVPRPGSPSTKPPHYDLGNAIAPTYMDIEGMTIWNAAHFNEVGGYDPLLFGHEGFELFARLLRLHGPHAFLYAPDAVLLHDFDHENKSRDVKIKRYDDNIAYLGHLGVKRKDLLSSITRYRKDPAESAVFISSLAYAHYFPSTSAPLVSIITTAKNVSEFLSEYTESIRRQGYENLEVVFVDDHSEDGTMEMARDLWKDDERLKLIKNDGEGRAAALNTALRNARGDVCVIADADDLLVPARIRWVMRYFEDHPDSACVSTYIFNERAAIRGTRPFVASPTSVRLRSFAGMPVSFPGFAFRRKSFPLEFNEELNAGIDCDWLFRHIFEFPEVDGHLLPIASSYYRLHDGQITTQHRSIQMDVAYERVKELHASYIRFDEDADKDTLLKLMGWQPLVNGSEIQALYDYVSRFVEVVPGGYPLNAVRDYLTSLVKDIHLNRMKHDYGQIKAKLETGRSDNSPTASMEKSSSPASLVNLSEIEKGEDEWLRDVTSRLGSFPRWKRVFGFRVKAAIPSHFSEEEYLQAHPDVRAAVVRGDFLSGFHHFVKFGRNEGRSRPYKSD